MTTPTPAQQLEEVVCELGRFTRSGPHDAAAFVLEHAPTLRRALAALEAVEGAAHGTAGYYSRPPLRAVTGIAIECTADNIERLVHKRVLIIPAGAVEVSRG